jgi:hypothetical protein
MSIAGKLPTINCFSLSPLFICYNQLRTSSTFASTALNNFDETMNKLPVEGNIKNEGSETTKRISKQLREVRNEETRKQPRDNRSLPNYSIWSIFRRATGESEIEIRLGLLIYLWSVSSKTRLCCETFSANVAVERSIFCAFNLQQRERNRKIKEFSIEKEADCIPERRGCVNVAGGCWVGWKRDL